MLERLATLRFDAAAMLNLSRRPSSIATATWRAMPRPSARSSTRQTARDLAVIGIDDAAVARHGRSLPHGATHLRRPAGGCLVRRGIAARRRARSCRMAEARRCPARTTRRTPRRPRRWRSASASRATAIARGHRAAFPACRIASSASSTIDGVDLHQRQQGDQCRRGGARAGLLRPRRSGSPAAWPRRAASTPLAPFFPRIARALLIGRDAPMFAATLRRARRAVSRSSRRWTRAVPAALRRRASAAGAPSCCCRRPARAGTSSPASTQRGDRFAELVACACRRSAPDAELLARRQFDAGPLVVDASIAGRWARSAC